MRVTQLDGGHFTSPAGLWRSGEDMERQVRFPVPAYLVEVGEERILVDTGLNPDAAADAARHYEGAESIGFFTLEQERPVAEQVALDSLTKVVLTHLHFDHAGGSSLLPRSLPVYVQRREWEAGADPDAVARNFFLPRDYEGLADQVVLVDGDHDLLGDGSVELLLTPGHTRGHQSVRVGNTIIGADVVHFATGLDDLRFPPFGDDRAAQRASALRLRAWRDRGLTVLPGHDPSLREEAIPVGHPPA
jgi:glyoxylase-like metal-dependent hydrolase (beta-lactamase superfamily II)